MQNIQPKNIFDTFYGFAGTQALAVAIKIDLFSIIQKKINTIEKISDCLKLKQRDLNLLLNALVICKLLKKNGHRYHLTLETKTYLVKDKLSYLGNLMTRANENFEVLKHLGEVINSGVPFIPTLNHHTKAERIAHLVEDLFPHSFSAAKVAANKLEIGKKTRNLQILDLACGSGAWSLAFTLADPTSFITAFDIPGVIETTQQIVKKFNLEKRYRFIPGDLYQTSFEYEKYDLVILGNICRMIGEIESRKLIKKVYSAIKNKGKIIISDWTSDTAREERTSLLFGLYLLTVGNTGEVFSTNNFKQWLTNARFKKIKTFKTIYPITVTLGSK